MGPAYLLEGACLCDQASGLFYTDDDIAHCERLARMRAGYVERESSGIADVRVERLARLRRLDRDLEGESWCITFALDEARQRPVPVLGDEVEPTGSAAVLVLPWAGEFECMLGEVVGGDTDNAFVLACDGYCMK